MDGTQNNRIVSLPPRIFYTPQLPLTVGRSPTAAHIKDITMPSRHFLVAAALLVALLLPTVALAQVTITQAKANAGNVTPGDAAGFPITISRPGSYILKGNLTVPNENTHGIVIASSHVTLDLNGFAILGPTDCSGGLNPCAREGSGSGITTAGTPHFNITVRNGTVQGMGWVGVHLNGDSHLIERLHVRSNGEGGIVVTHSADRGTAIVQHNTVQRNAVIGIQISAGLVTSNTLDVNYRGVWVLDGAGMVSHNSFRRQAWFALSMVRGGYLANVFTENANNFGQLNEGLNLGQNVCDQTLCP